MKCIIEFEQFNCIFWAFLNAFARCEYISALSVDGSKVSVKSRTKSPSRLISPGRVRSLQSPAQSGARRESWEPTGEKTGPCDSEPGTGEESGEIQVTIQVDTLGRYRHGRDTGTVVAYPPCGAVTSNNKSRSKTRTCVWLHLSSDRGRHSWH